MSTRRGRSLVCGRDVCEGRRAVALRLPRDRPVRAVIDVFVTPQRDAKAARRFFQRAMGTTKVIPVEVVTDRAATYLIVLEELQPAPWHRTEQYANNRVEADHGRLKSRLRPMRGLKRDRSARVIIGGHAFVQNVRRGHFELAVEELASRRLAVAFDELAMAI
jgi:transposase-like protein